MKTVYSFCCIGLVLLLSQVTLAQSGTGFIKGKLYDSASKKPISLATVTLFSAADTAIITYRLSTSAGEFKVPEIPFNKACRIVISFSGYKIYRKEFELTASTPQFDIGSIYMEPDTKSLEEVLVFAERPPVIVRKDTIEFNASSFKTLPSALVEDLLKKLPGVQVSRNGDIMVNGKRVNKLLVDGKEFFGNDPKMATRNLPANVIDKVQVMDDKEAMLQNPDLTEADVGKVINLKLKKSIKKGWFGKTYAGGGTNNRYETGGIANIYRDTLQLSILGFSNNINKSAFGFSDIMKMGGFNRTGASTMSSFSGGGLSIDGVSFGGTGEGIQVSNGGGINFNNVFKKRVTLNTRYFFSNVKSEIDEFKSSQQFIKDTIITTRDSSMFTKTEASHLIGTTLRIMRPDNSLLFEFRPGISFSKGDNDGTRQFRTFSNNKPRLNSSSAINQRDEDRINYTHSMFVQVRFKKKGRTLGITNTASVGKVSQEALSIAQNFIYNDPLPASQLNLDQQRKLKNNVAELGLSLNFTEPVNKLISLRVTGGMDYLYSKNSIRTYDKNSTDNKYNLFNSTLSNWISRNGWAASLGTGIVWKIKKYTLRTTLKWQHYDFKNMFEKYSNVLKQNYNYVLPNISLSNPSFSLSYNANAVLPEMKDLQPVADSSNALFVALGNAALKPSVWHNFIFNYSKANIPKSTNFFVSAGGSYTANAIIRERYISSQGKQVSSPINVQGNAEVWSYTGYSRQYKLNKKLQFTYELSVSAGYKRRILIVNKVKANQNLYDAGPGIRFTLNANDVVEYSINYNIPFNKSVSNSSFFPKTNTVTHYAASNLIVRWPKKIVWETTVDYLYNPIVAQGIKKSNALWNVGVTYLFLKDDKGQLKLSSYDLLNQNASVSRFINENYIRDVQTTVLRRYFLLTFTYNIRNFKVKEKIGGRDRLFFF